MFSGVEPDHFDPVPDGVFRILSGRRRDMELERGEKSGC